MWKVKVVACVLLVAVATGCRCSNSSVDIGESDGGETLPPGDGGNGGVERPGEDAGTDGGSTLPVNDGIFNGGTGDAGFNLDPAADAGTGSGVIVDPQGNLILSDEKVDLHFMWIANFTVGTVSKYDTDPTVNGTGPAKELGRYWAVIPRRADGSTNTATAYDPAAPAKFSPSRTALDLYGDVWVANRATNVGGSVTKIANDPADCLPDRNGVAGVQTSTDVGDCLGGGPNGKIDGCELIPPADAPAADFLDPSKYDECVIFSTQVGTSTTGVGARALAIGPPLEIENIAGDAWVGIHSEGRVYRISAVTGLPSPIDPANPASPIFVDLRAPPSSWGATAGPYGAAVDGQGRLWVLSAPGDGTMQLTGLDARTGAHLVTTTPPLGAVNGFVFPDNVTGTDSRGYGIGIDGAGRVWIAGWNSTTDKTARPNGEGLAFRYDHSKATDLSRGWGLCNFKDALSQIGTRLGRMRGIAAKTDGTVWMSGDANQSGAASAQVIGFNGDTCTAVVLNTAPVVDATDNDTRFSVGIGLDRDGHVWTNNLGQSNADPNLWIGGNVLRVRTDTGAIENRTPHGYQTLTVGGTATRGSLYSYSDFTGYQNRNFTSPRGTYQRDFDGKCVAYWDRLTWVGQSNPPVTTIRARARSANDKAGLDAATPTAYLTGGATGGEMDLQNGPYAVASLPWLRVEFELATTDRQQPSPVLKSFGVTAFECELQ